MQRLVRVSAEVRSAAQPDFTAARLSWLIRLRWLALAGIGVGALLAASGAYPGVHAPLLFGTTAFGFVYNAGLFAWVRRRGAASLSPDRSRYLATAQAVVDMLLLTVVLWAAGGVRSPFVALYVFHVALVGMLGGARATLVAAAVAVGCAGLLALTDFMPGIRLGVWHPSETWQHVADFVAFVSTIGAVAYIVTHAMNELRARERALAEAQARASLELELLSTTLHQLDAGLEVVGPDGAIVWRNKRAEELAPFASDTRSWEGTSASRAAGRRRLRAHLPAGERVYERHELALEADARGAKRTMNLYLDHTAATLAEQQLLLAERLVSLGRVAQGVAHELNTPLATIRTLATDVREVLGALRSEEGGGERRAALLGDVDESASLIADETRRLGRITQSLLSGGDLVRSAIDGQVRVAAVVERARALVFAGVQDGPDVRVDTDVDELSVVADPDRLVQVLVNLLQNASDAVRERGAHVTVRACRQGGTVALIVEDDGPGIDPAIRARLFEPFASTKPPGEGTGLGLYTSFMLVEAMAGTLTVEPREEGGTRATVRLPAAATRRHRTPHQEFVFDRGDAR